MQLRLTIEYLTRWGDEVRVCGSIPELGGGAEERAVALHTADGKRWTLQLDFCPPRETYIEYRYLVFRSGAVVRREWGNYPRILRLRHSPERTYTCFDAWRDVPRESLYFTGLFTSGPTKHVPSFPVMRTYSKSLVLRAFAPRVKEGFCLGLLGSEPALGEWNPDRILLMNDADSPEWRIELDASRLKYPAEYKFIIYDPRYRRILIKGRL